MNTRAGLPVRLEALVTVAASFLFALSPSIATAGSIDSAWQAASDAHWRDDTGAPFDFASLRGQRLILTMAFTRCQFVCPMAIAHLQELQRQLDASGQSGEFVVVGYAGARDTPSSWHRYRLHHKLVRPNWHFLSGDTADAESFARNFGFTSWKYDEHVMHELRILIFDRDGTFRSWNSNADRSSVGPQS